jgi:hypothetical protein
LAKQLFAVGGRFGCGHGAIVRAFAHLWILGGRGSDAYAQPDRHRQGTIRPYQGFIGIFIDLSRG